MGIISAVRENFQKKESEFLRFLLILSQYQQYWIAFPLKFQYDCQKAKSALFFKDPVN